MEYNLMTTDLMRIYSKTRGTIYNWIAAGIPCKKAKDGLRTVYKFNSVEVTKWLEED